MTGAGGLITFALGGREFATPLAAVREVVRLDALADLPGMAPPLAGVLDLRGSALPVLDLRIGAAADARADVLVLDRPGGAAAVGVAVDRVRAVVEPAELPPAGAGAEEGVLPAYVLEVLRGRGGPVFLVDLSQMAGAAGLDGLPLPAPPGSG